MPAVPTDRRPDAVESGQGTDFMMNRLQGELQRLYLPASAAPTDTGSAAGVRAMVLEVARPTSWSELGAPWQGVQEDLQLPAPAIAVSGSQACQLWFSLLEPVPAEQAQAFLAALRRRYLGAVPPERVRLLPAAQGPGAASIEHVLPVPPAQVAPERWAAFVAPDLAPLFVAEPWLDHPPGADAQAELLSRFESIRPEAFARAWAQLAASETAAAAPPPGSALVVTAPVPALAPAPIGEALDPRRFLLAVMHDPAVDLQLRVEAAKALLPYMDEASGAK